MHNTRQYGRVCITNRDINTMEHTIVELNTDYVPTMNTDVSLIKKGTRGVIV